MGILIAIHIMICVLLITIILIQAGRGGGLVENFSGVESMFGPKTSTFLTRSTSVLSILFFITCIGLAVLSAKQSRSLMKNIDTHKSMRTIPVQQKTTQPASAKAESSVSESTQPETPKK